jgi:hypothetical protein
MQMGRALVFAVSLIFQCSIANAEGRHIALLIANQAYDPSVGALQNPERDIERVAGSLAATGFEVLPLVKDGTRVQILGAVRNLVSRLNEAGPDAVGFIYYSGHGVAEQASKANYLIPVDAKDPDTPAFWDISIKMDDLIGLYDGAPLAAKFIVFDACRNEIRMPTRGGFKGLIPIPEQEEMFIAFATAPGRTASDGGADGGPYAAALAAELQKTSVDHLSFFQNVKESVIAATSNRQKPWESNGLSRRVYLTGKPQPGAPAVASLESGSANPAADDRRKGDLSGTYRGYATNGNEAYKYEWTIKQNAGDLSGTIAISRSDASDRSVYSFDGQVAANSVSFRGRNWVGPKNGSWCIASGRLTVSGRGDAIHLDGNWGPLDVAGGCLPGSGGKVWLLRE